DEERHDLAEQVAGEAVHPGSVLAATSAAPAPAAAGVSQAATTGPIAPDVKRSPESTHVAQNRTMSTIVQAKPASRPRTRSAIAAAKAAKIGALRASARRRCRS